MFKWLCRLLCFNEIAELRHCLKQTQAANAELRDQLGRLALERDTLSVNFRALEKDRDKLARENETLLDRWWTIKGAVDGVAIHSPKHGPLYPGFAACTTAAAPFPGPTRLPIRGVN